MLFFFYIFTIILSIFIQNSKNYDYIKTQAKQTIKKKKKKENGTSLKYINNCSNIQ